MNSIVGFNNQENYILKNFKNNNLHNSIILSGEKGIGKKTFIIELLKKIICLNLSNDNKDHHTNLIENNTHPNLKFVSRIIDTKTKKLKQFITIDQIRFLNSFFLETSFLNNISKFIVIDCADDLNLNSSNGLLKILEEPKSNTFFFLITHKISSLLPTIRSRCLKIKFNNHSYDDFKLIIEKKINLLKEDQVRFLFDLSNGSPGHAINLYDEEILLIFEELINSLKSSNDLSYNQIEISKKLSKYENDKFKIFLSLLKFILINISKLNNGIDISNYFSNRVVKNIAHISTNISNNLILRKLEYLINNENDLFTYNLDKNLFLLNFFTEK